MERSTEANHTHLFGSAGPSDPILDHPEDAVLVDEKATSQARSSEHSLASPCLSDARWL